MDTPYLTRSVVSSVDTVLRLRERIAGRIRGLDRYYINILSSDPDLRTIYEDTVNGLNSLLDRLDNNNIIPHDVYRGVYRIWMRYPQSLELHCIELFGSYKKVKYNKNLAVDVCKAKVRHYEKTGQMAYKRQAEVELRKKERQVDLMDRLEKVLFEGSVVGRAAELKRRLAIELEQRNCEGWFIVFNTLTVSNYYLSKVFGNKDAKEFELYIRSLDRLFAKAAYGSVRAAKDKEYHSYFAVVERGSETGRLHIHCIHIFKSLPGHSI